jgi:hypothetical protein
MEKSKAKSWEVGTVRKKNGNTYIVFNKDVKLSVTGQGELDLGEHNTAFINGKDKMNEDLAFKLEKGWMSEEQVEQAQNAIEEKNIVGNIRLKFKG